MPEKWQNWQPLSPYGRDDICQEDSEVELFKPDLIALCRNREAARLFASLGDPEGEYLRWDVAWRMNNVWLFDEMIGGSTGHRQKVSPLELSHSIRTSYLPGGRGVLPIFRQRVYWSVGSESLWRTSSMDSRH
eukprot:4197582-Amphidinium_carterae.1